MLARRPLAALGAAALLLAAAPGAGAQTPVTKDRPDGCAPLETRAPNGAGQRPAFPGQTRTCGIRDSAPYTVTVVAGDLGRPWAVEPLPSGDFLVTEKGGAMRIVSANGASHLVDGVLPVDARGQGGLLDVALSPGFATDRTIYWSFTERRGEAGNGTSVARGTLSADMRRLEQVRVILQTSPTYRNNMHFGSRLAFGPDGMLYVTMGERSDQSMRVHAQALDNHLGKVLRITTEGRAPSDNPFVGRAGALAEIWTYGHRNIQAAAFDAQGRFWDIEHGTRGGDELNLVERGRNYGWPVAAYGIEYRGGPLQNGTTTTTREGTEQAVYYWDPVIAPSGAQWYSGALFPAWQGSLFVGGLASQRLVRLVVANGRVTGEEHLLSDRNQRIRDVKQGIDGALYVVTDSEPGQLLRITPR